MRQCSEGDCDSPVLARGWCRKHYLRWSRKQNPEKYREYRRRDYQRNRARRLKQAQRRYAADPDRFIEQVRRRRVMKQYGLTLEDYETTLARGCAICGSDGPRMAMDHDHATGELREALCANCNNGLGRFQDDPDRLRAAADYLERHQLRRANG